MGPRKDVIDIISTLGGVETVAAAGNIFKELMDAANLGKLEPIKNEAVLLKIANAATLCQPDSIYIVSGSEEDLRFVRNLALEKGEESTLAMPLHTIHFDLKEEQGRIIDRTFYISNEGEEVNSLANKMTREDALNDIEEKMAGIMKGKIMMVGFYLRGPVGAPASNPAVEISSSTYVMHSAEILYRNIYADFDREVERLGHFFANIHSEGLEPARGPAQCAGVHGSQSSDDLQLQLHLRR